MNARVAKKLGIGTIRGSTARDPSRVLEKGGMVGFLEMKAALEEGACVSMTADISNLAARRAGLGIVALAKASGRPIVPIAYATSRRLDVDELGPGDHQPALQPRRLRHRRTDHGAGRRRRCGCSRQSGARSRTRLNEATARAYRHRRSAHG